jgi:predicted permease
MALGITYLMGFEDPAMQRTVILSSGAPTGTLAAVLICFYGRINEKRFTALCIVVTSLLSYGTIPVLLLVLNTILPIETL